MDRRQYIEFYTNHYGHPPPQGLLDKYYPVEEEIPEPTPEEWERFWREE